MNIHLHGIAYAHWDRKGDYTVLITVSETEDNVWGDWDRERYPKDFPAQGRFSASIRIEGDVTFVAPDLHDMRALEWTASSTLRIKEANDEIKVTYRDYSEKKGNTFASEDEGNNGDNSSNSACPIPGIYPTAPNQTPSPGDTYSVHLITDGPYSQVYWYVKAPWETTYYGTNVETDSGDGTATTASLNYTFPSGAMHTGDFKITAYIYRHSDLSVYEESYTVTVSSN